MILNASGCLDALTAPDVARHLDAFVTKTITPLPRAGNAPVRIAETEHGMLNAIGLQGPGIERFVGDHLPRLAELGVDYCEQPLPAGDQGGARLKAESPIPIYVDEDCHALGDIAECSERAHGVNIKLAKSGGIREGIRMAHAARALDLGVMLGCMVESGLGIAAGAHMASLCDHVDLDGNLLLASDPWPGLEFVNGVQTPAEAPGLGVRPAVPA